MSTPDVELRPLVDDDVDDVLGLNQRCVPHVGDLDAERLAALVEAASLALVARDPGASDELAAFVIVLPPGADYGSPNYRYFEERYDDHRYVDRVAVDPARHRSGLGRLVYAAVFDHARAEGCARVTCEVNVEPPNPTSQEFHRSLGFNEVGRQDAYGGTVRVSLLVRDL